MLWTSLVDNAESPPGEHQARSRMIYLVEPLNLLYVVREERKVDVSGSPAPTKVHFPVSEHIQQTAKNIPYEARNIEFQEKELELLQWKGVFTTPHDSIADRLLQTYFETFHPNYPIVNRGEFSSQLETNSVSLLVLHAIFFIAVTHCESSLIIDAGFPSREAARLSFYQKAKALYDADYESDSISNIQALFLISFWWGGALDQKDTWHWLGAATGLAQSKGIHRS